MLTSAPMGEVLSGADLEAQQRNDLSGLGELILRLLLVSVAPVATSSEAPSSCGAQAEPTSSVAAEPPSSCDCMEQALDMKTDATSLRALLLKQIADNPGSGQEQGQDHAVGAEGSGDGVSEAAETATASVMEVSSASKLPWQMLAVADTLLSARCHNTADEAEEESYAGWYS